MRTRGREGEGRERENDIPWTYPLPKCLKWLGLGGFKPVARNPNQVSTRVAGR